MARIGRKHHNNFIRRKTNYSFVQSDYYYLSGTSVSASNQYGPAIHNFNMDDLTVKQDRPRVDPETIEFNDNRRPFFEDQFTWARPTVDASKFEDIKYIGSGTLATDEVSGYFRGNGTPLLKPGPISVGGKEQAEIQTWSDLSGWSDDMDGGSLGIKNYTFTSTDGTHNIYFSKRVGFINRWVFKPNTADSDADSITLTHDGFDFGRQAYGDQQYIERFNNWFNPDLVFAGALSADSVSAYITNSRPNGVPLDQPEYSGVIFNPPLPTRYINPIPDTGFSTYDSLQNIADASVYYPEAYLQNASKQGMAYYSNVTSGTDNKLTLEGACIVTDYSSELKGGDALSGSTQLAAGGNGKTFAEFYNSNSTLPVNPTSGFLETWVNQVEAGYVPNTNVVPMSFLLYVKNELNYGGEGVHRQVIAEFRNHNFEYQNYANFKAYRRDNGDPIADEYRDKYISAVGELEKSNPTFATYGKSINSQIGSFLDSRFDNMYLYSPENGKLIEYNAVSASKLGAIPLNPGDHTFNVLPSIPVPTGIQNSSVSYRYAGPTPEGNFSLADNFTTFTENGGFGTVENPIAVTYTNVVSANDDDPLWLGSTKVLSIFERSADNPGGLASQAVGFYIVLDNNRFNTVGKTDYLLPDNVVLTTHNGMTSGVNGSKNVSAAHASVFAQDKWTDVAGSRTNLAPVEGTTWAALTTGNPYVPKGWVARHFLRIVGSDKDDVINKLNNFLDNNSYPAIIDAKDELPEVLLNYEHPLKGGKIH